MLDHEPLDADRPIRGADDNYRRSGDPWIEFARKPGEPNEQEPNMSTQNEMKSAISTSYSAIMNADKNPLSRLPLAQRFQAMVYLSIMWTSIFCAGFGAWYWYGELIVGHVLVVLGIVLTTVTFRNASRPVAVVQHGGK